MVPANVLLNRGVIHPAPSAPPRITRINNTSGRRTLVCITSNFPSVVRVESCLCKNAAQETWPKGQSRLLLLSIRPWQGQYNRERADASERLLYRARPVARQALRRVG